MRLRHACGLCNRARRIRAAAFARGRTVGAAASATSSRCCLVSSPPVVDRAVRFSTSSVGFSDSPQRLQILRNRAVPPPGDLGDVARRQPLRRQQLRRRLAIGARHMRLSRSARRYRPSWRAPCAQPAQERHRPSPRCPQASRVQPAAGGQPRPAEGSCRSPGAGGFPAGFPPPIGALAAGARTEHRIAADRNERHIATGAELETDHGSLRLRGPTVTPIEGAGEAGFGFSPWRRGEREPRQGEGADHRKRFGNLKICRPPLCAAGNPAPIASTSPDLRLSRPSRRL